MQGHDTPDPPPPQSLCLSVSPPSYAGLAHVLSGDLVGTSFLHVMVDLRAERAEPALLQPFAFAPEFAPLYAVTSAQVPLWDILLLASAARGKDKVLRFNIHTEPPAGGESSLPFSVKEEDLFSVDLFVSGANRFTWWLAVLVTLTGSRAWSPDVQLELWPYC